MDKWYVDGILQPQEWSELADVLAETITITFRLCDSKPMDTIDPLRMTVARSQLETQANDTRPSGPRQLLKVADLCAAIGVTPGWVYTRTKKRAIDPLPVVRLGLRGIRFDPDKISCYIRVRERHRPGATLDSSDGIAPISGKGHFKLTRKRIQTGSVRLHEDGDPAWWEGF